MISVDKVDSFCKKINLILDNMGKSIIWSLRKEGDLLTLIHYNTKGELTEIALNNATPDECYNFLMGYYLGLRHAVMNV